MTAAPVLCVAGASGFIGRHLLGRLAELDAGPVRCLTRDSVAFNGSVPGIEVVSGDMCDESALDHWIAPESIVINLAFDRNGPLIRNIEAAEALARACNRARVKRLVHLSTAAVAGRNPADVIDESSNCQPATPYESVKLRIEQTLFGGLSHTELIVLRPTAVFGPGGQNLLKLARETSAGSALARYVRACVQGCRTLNLVSVQTVAAALAYFAFYPSQGRETFIVSDDEAKTNNYRDVEQVLIRAFGRSEHPLPVLPVPIAMQKLMRRAAGRPAANVIRSYSSKKLLASGFVKPVTFDAALGRYAGHLAHQWRTTAAVPG